MSATTVSFADNQDGSGITLKISGGLPGQTNEAYILCPGTLQTTGWVLVASRTGPGLLAVSWVDNNLDFADTFFLKIVSGSDESNIIGVVATETVESVHWRAINSIACLLATVQYGGVPASIGVYREGTLTTENHLYPAFRISPEGRERIEPLDATTNSVFVPVVVDCLISWNPKFRAEIPKILQVRETTRGLLERQEREDPYTGEWLVLPGAREILETRIIGGDIWNEERTNETTVNVSTYNLELRFIEENPGFPEVQ